MVFRIVVALGALLLASATNAAERAAPVISDGLRDCPGGGFALPGSDGCIRLSGAVTATSVFRSGASAATPGGSHAGSSHGFSSHVVGRAAADVRVPTELGPVRVYTSLRAIER